MSDDPHNPTAVAGNTGSMPGIGIDFGTSNSCVAMFDGKRLYRLNIESTDPPSFFMPTALYLDRKFQPTLGQHAIDEYLEHNTNRSITLGREEIGEFEMTVGQTEADAQTILVKANAFTDVDMPGRLFRGIKTWLGHEDLVRTAVFGKKYHLTALVTPILAYLREQAESATGGKLPQMHIGRPVNYEGSGDDASDTNDIAISRFEQSCEYAGLSNFQFYPEPVAAALSYLYLQKPQGDLKILCFDFGGGTLDMCVLQGNSETREFTVLATHGIGLGGDAIDREIYRQKIFPELGKGTEVPMTSQANAPMGEFRFYEYEEGLLNWPFTHTLNTPVLREQIRRGVDMDGETGHKLLRLRQLIRRNFSYLVFQAIERAKIELSEKEESAIVVRQLDLNVPITRADFEEILQPYLSQITECVDRAIELAGVEPGEIDAVVRTGGSSCIPVVRESLENRFPGKVIEHDTFNSIAAGLAIANYHGYNPPQGRKSRISLGD